MTGNALQDRAVLAVYRNDFSCARRARLPDKISGDDERFLVRQRDALPALERRQSRVESRRADDGVENDVDVRARGRGNQRFRSTLPRLITVALRLHHSDERRRELPRLFSEQCGVAVRGECGDPESLTLSVQDTERRCAY